MAGIQGRYDSRIFRYFGVGNYNGYQRAVIQLVKTGRFRNDALADLLDILKLRYNLSDKVLFHPKKCAADAMLIKAVAQLNLGVKDRLKNSDNGLLDTCWQQNALIKLLPSAVLSKPGFASRLHAAPCNTTKHE